MLSIRRTGPSMADVIRDIGDVHARVLPYAAAAALTKNVKRAQSAVIEEMRRDFRNPVAYTLNATRIEVATAENLKARLAVKDQRSGNGTRPESFLLPEVEGGQRKEKGFERALRAAGILAAGEWALPGSGVQLDAAGNVSGSTVRSVLRQVQRPGARQARGTGAIFAGAVGRKQTRGIWQRNGDGLKALFIFTRTAPTYRSLLDFEGAAAASVRENFAADFYAAASSIRRKFTS
ncbi:hypothetical protein [Variovorax atrisoli]|uniref:hypothetical protein n=1 Tax=Variovorax atrisoli TaxID=3394203 RepID=UPI0012FD1AA9|nr:hypothetical protein [Variovorax paradoxus]